MESQQQNDVSNNVGTLRTANCHNYSTPESMPGDILRNLQNVSYIYRQDVVTSKINGKIGIVIEVAGDSDSDSSLSDDEDDDDEEDEDIEEQKDNNEKFDLNTDTDSHKSNHLPADQVRVLWSDESKTTQNINTVEVIDRGFLHGDHVAAASDPTGQVGVVVDVNITVDLLTHDGSLIRDVSSRELKRVRDFTIGDYVVLGPWLGRIEDVFDNVTVLFDDGSVCKVRKADPMRLKPSGKSILEDGHFPYYPGQHVRATSSSVFKNCIWLSGVWKAHRLEGTVIKVTVGSVFIYWIASAGFGPDSSTTPAEEQSPKNLKLLSCFSHASWQLGDWCLLPSSILSSSIPLEKELTKIELCDSAKDESESAQTKPECDDEVVPSEESNENGESVELDGEVFLDGSIGNVEKKPPPESSSCGGSIHESWPLHRKKIHKVVIRRDKKTKRKEENFERAVLIVNTKTKVCIAWQDGTVEQNLHSTALIPIDSPGDHEFVSEQYVVEKAADDGDDATEVRRVGVVKDVNAKEKTAHVRWLKQVARAEDPREFDNEEVVSVYQLEGHPDYDYCYGDVVVRLSPVFVISEVESVVDSSKECKQPPAMEVVKRDKKKFSGCENVDDSLTDDGSAEFSDLSWVGHITGLRNGDIEVTWADGMISTVGPQAIYVVGRADDESIAPGSDAASWETVEDDEMETLENFKEDIGAQSATDFSPENEEGSVTSEYSGRNGALAIPLAALGFVSRLASGIFSRSRRHIDQDSRSQSMGLVSKGEHEDESSSHILNVIGSSTNLHMKPKEEEYNTAGAADLSGETETLCKLKPEMNDCVQLSGETSSFRGFDITMDPCDHHFRGASEQNGAGRKWLRKIQQDWNVLQNNLPDGIYVRVYEDRMDLLRAVIVGAYGTPYQDGLFFFDFHLPPEYPDVPPSAYYHSGGWRINPNLYEEGKVCLSLLNTWTGRGNEVWDPSSSSILQVLVSLQGLVLNSKPYFNEAGYDKQIGTAEGEKNSVSYNENTFLLNCKTMMYLIRKPPKDFEEFIQEHFRRRGYYILKACDAYMKGYLIGSLTKDASVTSNNYANSNSVGFKLMLTKIVPRLYMALCDVGADCHDFKHLQQS